MIDFPSTYAQAKLLETALSGYITPTEQDPIDREKQSEDAFLLVQPSAKEQPPKTLLKSGLDAVFWFDVSREECMRRALGRKFDPETQTMYHIEDVPPPTNQAPLCERLVSMDEEVNLEATLIDRWMSFDQESAALDEWFNMFGDNKYNDSILVKLPSEKEEQAIFIRQQAVAILARKQEKNEAIMSKIDERLEEAEKVDAEKLKLAAEEEEERKKREEEGVPEGDSAAAKKDEAKVERPEPATERVPSKDPGVTNIDNDFKPTILKVWQELSETYKI